MKRLLFLPVGYVRIDFENADVRILFNFCNQAGIRPIRFRTCGKDGRLWLRRRDEAAVCARLSGFSDCVFTVRHIGLPYLLLRYRTRVGIWLGLALFVFTIFTAPKFLWSIRIVGAERLRESEIREILRTEGVYPGAYIPHIDRKAVYADLFRDTGVFAWLSVNIRGSVATVEVAERETVPAASAYDGVNLIASQDGVITDVDVQRGEAAVRLGQTVRKGDLLISGIMRSDFLGTRYRVAAGTVRAYVSEEFTVEVPLADTEKRYGEEVVCGRSVVFFEKSVNIFEKPFPDGEKYDTINREENLLGEWLCRLPVRVRTVSALPYTEVSVTLTEAEALDKAEKLLAARFAAADGELLTVQKSRWVENGVLTLTATAEMTKNIAAESPFTVRWTAERNTNAP